MFKSGGFVMQLAHSMSSMRKNAPFAAVLLAILVTAAALAIATISLVIRM